MATPQANPAHNLQTIPSQTCNQSAPQRRWGKSNERQQAVAIQRILEATIKDPATPAQSRASCAAAWSRVQEAKRIIDGKPLPGQLRPDLAQAKGQKRIGPPARSVVRVMPKPVAPSTPVELSSTPVEHAPSPTPVVSHDQSMLNDPASPSQTGG